MTGLLMRTLTPYGDESPRGFLTRLSEANGYSVDALLGLIPGMRVQRLSAGWDYSQLSPVLGALCHLPPGFGYRVPNKQARELGQLLGAPLHTRHLGLYKARICPSCLDDLGYVPAAWDLKAYIACPVHGCSMIKLCDTCGVRIKYSRPGVSVCRCGADLRKSQATPAAPEVIGFSEILHALAARDRSGLMQSRELGMPVENLLQMDLDVFVRVAVTIANVFQAMAHRRRTMRRYTEVVDALPKAAQALTNWPLRFQQLCRAWADIPTKRARDDGFQTKFTWLFTRLHKNLHHRGVQTKFMLEAALAYGTRRWDTRPIVIKNTGVETARLPHPRYGSASTAAKLIGIDPITAARWAAKGRIPATRCGKHCNRNWCVDLDAVRRIRFSRAGPVRRAAAAHELGLSQPALNELLKSQVIACTHFVKERPGLVAREDLDEFKQVLCRKCIKPEPGAVLIPLTAALRGKPSSRQAEIVRGVSEGRITLYGHRNDSMESVLVEQPRRMPAASKPVPKPLTHMTQAMTMRKYGVNHDEAAAIFRYLGSQQISRRRMQPVEIPRIELFFQRHTLVRQIAHQHGLLSLQLTRALRRHRPGTLLSIAPKVGREIASARLVRNTDILYVHGVARRLAKKLGRMKVQSTK